jgi:hypothetical protein
VSIVPVNDGYESNPVVRQAVEALSAFGGDLSYGQAQRLLPAWRFYSELTDRERTAVLARFPRACADTERDLPPIQEPGNSAAGW